MAVLPHHATSWPTGRHLKRIVGATSGARTNAQNRFCFMLTDQTHPGTGAGPTAEWTQDSFFFCGRDPTTTMEGELIGVIIILCILVALCLPWVANVIRGCYKREFKREPWRLGMKVVSGYGLAIFIGLLRRALALIVTF